MVAVVRISIRGDGVVNRNNARFRQLLREEVGKSLAELGVIGKSTARRFAPVAFGFLRNSINFLLAATGLKMTLIAGAPYAAYVNFGTRPHWTPPGALDEWARRRGLDEQAKKAIRFSISKKGTKANPFFTRAGLFLSAGAPRFVEEGVNRAVSRFNAEAGGE